MSLKVGLYAGIFYGIYLVLACYNLFFFSIELYCVCNNLTYNEIFNRNKYNYLFRIKKDPRGQFVKHFFNPYDKGTFRNIKEYVLRAFGN